jgi:hypothetical protein
MLKFLAIGFLSQHANIYPIAVQSVVDAGEIGYNRTNVRRLFMVSFAISIKSHTNLPRQPLIEETPMCRNIKPLFNFETPATEEEIQAAALQFVRKITGYNKPSQANEAAFYTAVNAIAAISSNLLETLETTAPPKNREEEAEKAKIRSLKRFGK